MLRAGGAFGRIWVGERTWQTCESKTGKKADKDMGSCDTREHCLFTLPPDTGWPALGARRTLSAQFRVHSFAHSFTCSFVGLLIRSFKLFICHVSLPTRGPRVAHHRERPQILKTQYKYHISKTHDVGVKVESQSSLKK